MATRSTPAGTRATGAPPRSAAAGAPSRTRGPDAPRDTPRVVADGGPRAETAVARAAAVAGRLSALPRVAADRARVAADRARDVGESVRAGVRDRMARRRAARDLADDRTEGTTDWRRVGAFGAGLAIGALLGAGTALLMAPSSGFETRVRLARGARRAGGRVVDRWDDLGDTVRRSAHRGRSQVERQLTRGRWAAEDAWERRREMARARAAGLD